VANSDGYPWEAGDHPDTRPRVFTPTRSEQARMDAALRACTAPSAEIRRQQMRPLPMPPRYGRGSDTTILTCWEEPQVITVHSIMDYSDDEAMLQSTPVPALRTGPAA
jgi:hypothetical protein